MINTMRKKHNINLRSGMSITGKWHQNKYIIKEMLGFGTVGTVYLCENKGRYAALKISEQSSSMTVEVNVLKTLQKVQGACLGPSLLDIDDWVDFSGNMYTFYVMEYIQGEHVNAFMQKNGSEWMGVFLLQLLESLHNLHQAGWVFGDLKTDNLLIVSSPTRIRWVDVGGTTQIGRAIKEYTEFYDRGYWGLGSRRAEPSYDLFSAAMVMLAIVYPNHFSRGVDPTQTIFDKLKKATVLKPYQASLEKAILGQYQTSLEMKQDIITIWHRRQNNHLIPSQNDSQKTVPFFIEGSGILLLASVFYFSSLLFP